MSHNQIYIKEEKLEEVRFGDLEIGDKFGYVDETWTKTSKNLAKINKYNSSFDINTLVIRENNI